MKPTEMKVGDLLYQRQPFVIPRYQRSYAWEDEQIKDFSEDLVDLSKRRASGAPRSHFFGGVVSIMEAVAGTGAGREYQVIDGQQRLATFMLTMTLVVEAYAQLASKLRDSVKKNTAQARAELLRSEYIEYTDIREGQRVTLFRLVLSKADSAFFDALLRGESPEPTRESHKRLAQAKTKLRRLIIQTLFREKDSEQSLSILDALETTLREDCQVIHLVADSRYEAYRLFQVLNDRGIKLTEGDLLRSQVLELLEKWPTAQSTAESAWDQMLSADFDETEAFLRSYYASHKGERPGRRTLLDDFSAHFLPKTVSTADEATILARKVEEMALEFSLFRRISDSEWPFEESDPHVSAWDQDRLKLLIDDLNHRLAMPLIVTGASKLDVRRFAELVHLVERFVFRYVNISKQHVGTLNDVYHRHSVAIRQNPSTYSVRSLEEDLAALLQNSPAEHFATSLVQRLTYKGSGTKTLKYFLLTIEQFMSWIDSGANGSPRCSDKSAVYDTTQLQIEHIYPQNAATVETEL